MKLIEASLLKQYNPRYLVYCWARGYAPEEMLAVDAEEWPGAKMAGFMLWLEERRAEWSQHSGRKRGSGWGPAAHAALNIWLAERYSPVKRRRSDGAA